MKTIVEMTVEQDAHLRAHLFQDWLEQGAFLFARTEHTADRLIWRVCEIYCVPPDGWEVQTGYNLVMRDAERARIMKMARDRDCAVVDCHSHAGTAGPVAFSPSDVAGTTDFAQYAKWKLTGKPYAALVFGQTSVDAVSWYGDFAAPKPIDEVRVASAGDFSILRPVGSWFAPPKVVRPKRKRR